MQTQTLWCCGTGTPFSFSAMRSAVGAFLLARSRKQRWTVLPDAGMTPDEVDCLRDELDWLGVVPDEFFHTTRQSRDCGCAAAAHLITGGQAYCRDVHGRRRVFFCLPEVPVLQNVIVPAGPKGMMLQPDMTVEISRQGICFWHSGDDTCRRCAFAAMPELVLRRSDGRELFNAVAQARQLGFGKRFRFSGASMAEFIGREVVFSDANGLAHRFPLEQIDDPVVIDETGQPTPLFRRVLTAIEINASTVAGDGLDEREAAQLTLLFDAFGYPPPSFQLLPPVTDIGSAPDHAACRRMGLMPNALFQELARLVCARLPESVEVSREDWIRRFRHRDRKSSLCRYKPEMLNELNRKILAQLPPEEFARLAAPYAPETIAQDQKFAELAKEKQPRTALLSEAAEWRF